MADGSKLTKCGNAKLILGPSEVHATSGGTDPPQNLGNPPNPLGGYFLRLLNDQNSDQVGVGKMKKLKDHQLFTLSMFVLYASVFKYCYLSC